MHRTVHMLLSASVIALSSTTAFAQETPAPAEQQQAEAADATATTDAPEGDQAIVVTARKRSEVLQDVPVAVTAVTGDTIEKRGLTQIKDVAQLTPSLNVNSDGVGRVFLAVRGVGTTLVGTVQPGVGIFVDGVYQPNTSYLNNPLVDVDRVEVLRGPQGTLYGKNTLGGALSVITRQPTNRFTARVGGSYAGPDNAWDVHGSVSGPIIEDKLQVKVAAAHRQQDGFIRNTLLDTDANSLNMDTVAATVRAAPTEGVVLTVNGYYEWVEGGSIPYAHIDGPTDYQRTLELNAKNTQKFQYKGVNAKLEVEAGTDTNITLIGSYDERDGHTPDLDGDFNSIDLVHQTSRDELKTSSAELRFDSEWSDQFSTLIGFYYSHEALEGHGTTVTQFAPLGLNVTKVNATVDEREGDSYAAFANVFWKPKSDLEVALGLRLDHEKRTSGGALGVLFPLPGSIDLEDAPEVPVEEIDEETIESTKLLPKLTLTKHWNDDLMTYASIAKGFRGGGFNGPTAPFRTYNGDSVWTYEIGSKYISADRRLSLAGAIFYNDYKDYIGLNNFVRGTDGNAVTVDFNTGDVKSYGAEIEVLFKPTRAWTITGGASYVHARVTDDTAYHEATVSLPLHPNGLDLASKRLPFQPDWTFNINSDYVVPLGKGDLTITAGAVAKGSRIGATISETRAPVLKSYVLFNTALTYAIGNVEIGAFVDNLFDKKYYNSFIEKSTLESVFGPGPLASDLGIIGDKRRYGVRARFRY